VSAATVLHRLARSGAGSEVFKDQRFAELLLEAEASLATAGPQACASMAWALATLRFANEPLLQAIASASLSRMNEFGFRELSNIAWSVARI